MTIELQPKQKRVIGFKAQDVYYLDLNGVDTLVVYDPKDHAVYNNNISHYRYVYSLYGGIQNIYIEE